MHHLLPRKFQLRRQRLSSLHELPQIACVSLVRTLIAGDEGVAGRRAEVAIDAGDHIAATICIASAAAFAQSSNAAKLFREAENREAALRMDIDARKADAPAMPLPRISGTRPLTLSRMYQPPQGRRCSRMPRCRSDAGRR